MNLVTQRISGQMTEEEMASSMEAFTTSQGLTWRRSTRIAIKVKEKILLINSGDVIAVLAEGNYVSLQRGSSSHLLRESISMVAEKLEPFGFVRIHRSVIVNGAFVEEIKPYPTGEWGLRVKGGKEYTVTRTYKRNLQSLAEFGIGTGVSFPTRAKDLNKGSSTDPK